MIYVVPTSKANEWLEGKEYIVATDEGEAVALACGEYMGAGRIASVVMGDNGLLNALDAIITLSQLHEIPIDLHIFPRKDEPQHAMVTQGLEKLLKIYKIKATIHK